MAQTKKGAGEFSSPASWVSFLFVFDFAVSCVVVHLNDHRAAGLEGNLLAVFAVEHGAVIHAVALPHARVVLAAHEDVGVAGGAVQHRVGMLAVGPLVLHILDHDVGEGDGVTRGAVAAGDDVAVQLVAGEELADDVGHPLLGEQNRVVQGLLQIGDRVTVEGPWGRFLWWIFGILDFSFFG